MVQALTSLNVFSVNTGAGFRALGSDGDGVKVSVITPSNKIESETRFESYSNILDSLANHKKLKGFSSLRKDIDNFCESTSKSASTGDLVLAAKILKNARAQLNPLDLIVAELQARICDVPKPIPCSCDVKKGSIAIFTASEQNRYPTLQPFVETCGRIIRHLIEDATSMGVDFVFFRCIPGGFVAFYDNGVKHVISLNSLDLNNEAQILNNLRRVEALISHNFSRSVITSFSNALANNTRDFMRILGCVIRGLYKLGYAVGSDPSHPLVLSLWGDDSPVGKSLNYLYDHPIAHEKLVLLPASNSYASFPSRNNSKLSLQDTG